VDIHPTTDARDAPSENEPMSHGAWGRKNQINKSSVSIEILSLAVAVCSSHEARDGYAEGPKAKKLRQFIQRKDRWGAPWFLVDLTVSARQDNSHLPDQVNSRFPN
jgi:hypothetical protein